MTASARLKRLYALAEEVNRLELTAEHEPTGLQVWVVVVMLMTCIEGACRELYEEATA